MRIEYFNYSVHRCIIIIIHRIHAYTIMHTNHNSISIIIIIYNIISVNSFLAEKEVGISILVVSKP